MLNNFQLIDLYFPWVIPTWVFFMGACVGSFLNVCIIRIPAEKSVVAPRSSCGCGEPIAWFDNIPILSWFILRGRARCCGRHFSFRYPAIEALTAVLFLLCWLLFTPAKAFCGMIFCSMMIAATFIDFDHMIIPDRFSIGGFIVGVVLAGVFPSLHGFEEGYYLANSFRSFIAALEGAFVGSALVLWIALLAELILRKEAMGFGDVKLMGAIGAFCGWQGSVFAMFGGAVIGMIGVLIFFPLQHFLNGPGGRARKEDSDEKPDTRERAEEEEGGEEKTPFLMGRQVPFGPMLAAAGVLYFLYLHERVDAYFGQFAILLNAP